MNKGIFVLLFLASSMALPACMAESMMDRPSARLKQLVEALNEYPIYQLDFKQTNQSTTTGQIIKGEGYLTIQKPDRFDWIYTSRPMNRITCDGNYIVMLMPDTQQAMTEKAENKAVIWSPISLLSKANIESHFRMKILDDNTEKSQIRLFPIQPDQPYEYLELTLYENSSKLMFSLLIYDLAGNTNILDFSGLKQIEDRRLIVFPPIPSDYDVTDFQGNPQDYRFF
ncbi:outer membrane lipoprotein carrier protein LolA [bacterium]|nr:outer membrane lipoprotein carrier protein LolA [candidate division CSSED10-310 bacterium]